MGNFIKHIAENIHLEGRLDSLTQEQLAAEFSKIDQSGDGYIQREEMKNYMMSDQSKAGKLSESDFNAMWTALDMDGSGQVDVMEFASFLKQCGGEYNDVASAQ